MSDEIKARLDAIERALTDREGDPGDAAGLADAAAIQETLATLEDRVDELEGQLTELDAGLQAVRGYVGNVRTVNRDVERRADAALATTQRLQQRLDDAERATQQSPAPESGRPSAGARQDDERDARDGRDHGRSDRPSRGPHGTERARDGHDQPDAERPGAIARRITTERSDETGQRTDGETDADSGFLADLRESL